MGKNARLRKLRREARRQLGVDFSAKSCLSEALQKKHPEAIVVPPRAGQKMSEVIQVFAEPLLEDADSPEEIQKALLLAMSAWNYSLLDEADRLAPGNVYEALFADPIVKEVFDSLLLRKQDLYPDNHRSILDYELISKGTEMQFNVISTFG